VSRIFAPFSIVILCSLLFATQGWSRPSRPQQNLAQQTSQLTLKPINRDGWIYDGNLSYRLGTDFAQEREPRAFEHRYRAEAAGTKSLNGKPWLRLGANLAVVNRSLDNEIVRDQDSNSLQDAEIFVSRHFDLGYWGRMKHGIILTGSNLFPLSNQSRYEGYRSVPSGEVSLQTQINPTFAVDQRFLVDYVVNTYRFSPVTQEVNPDWGVEYQASLGTRFQKWFRFDVGANVRTTHFLDSTNLLSFNNFQAISFSNQRFSLILAHINGQHLNQEPAGLAYIDQYRRLVRLTAVVMF